MTPALLPFDSEGARTFRALLQERTGYPERGALAAAARILGMSQHQLGRYLRGESEPTGDRLERLASYVGLSYLDAQRMLLGAGDQQPQPPVQEVHELRRLLTDALAKLDSM